MPEALFGNHIEDAHTQINMILTFFDDDFLDYLRADESARDDFLEMLHRSNEEVEISLSRKTVLRDDIPEILAGKSLPQRINEFKLTPESRAELDAHLDRRMEQRKQRERR